MKKKQIVRYKNLTEQILIIKKDLEDIEKKTIVEPIAKIFSDLITMQLEVELTNNEQKKYAIKNNIKRDIKAFVKEMLQSLKKLKRILLRGILVNVAFLNTQKNLLLFEQIIYI